MVMNAIKRLFVEYRGVPDRKMFNGGGNFF